MFQVADDYCMYREQFEFAAEGAAVQLGPVQVPHGKVKFDETFAKDVETHRGRVVITVPVQAAPAAFTLAVTSQGCADAADASLRHARRAAPVSASQGSRADRCVA